MGEAEFISKVNLENLKRKKSNKPPPPQKHSRERKKLINKRGGKKEFQVNFVRYFRL